MKLKWREMEDGYVDFIVICYYCVMIYLYL